MLRRVCVFRVAYTVIILQSAELAEVSGTYLYAFLLAPTDVSGVGWMLHSTHRGNGYGIKCDTRTPGTSIFFTELIEGSGIINSMEVVHNSQKCRLRI